MTDITSLSQNDLPSTTSLLKATGLAMVVAIALLLVAVLPAEYGIDPTGLGKKMGLTALAAPAKQESSQQEIESVSKANDSMDLMSSMLSPVWKSDQPYRNDTLELTLQPGEGKEIKARMQAGERFMFTWQAEGGMVNFDMHGEPLNAGKDEFTSYWKNRDQSSGHGYFEAPVAGTHGWYWRNRDTKPITIRVSVSGYYEKLYQP